MNDFLQPIVDVFQFIASVLQTIIDGIAGITSILLNVIQLIYSIIRVLPNQIYLCIVAFVSVYSFILIYKLIRKG